ncbi:amine sulfotransferase-like [Crotalus adamanteus]|uniref:Sulfotransferase n=1 Tax=Crotalus adamanteus TaxID=8729 RepID=A0AAW1CCX6_CROAD
MSSPEGIDLLDSLEIRDDDIFIITYPKSGTIWTQNIVSLIFHEGHRDETENITLNDRAPWLEYNILHVDFPSRPSPRLFTSHLPYYLVPKGLRSRRAKIIYVLRNPKDILVSSYHFHKILVKLETPKDFSTFFEKFLAGKVLCSSWLDHVEGWYAHKGDFNILFLSYEEMKKDLRSKGNFLRKGTVGDWKNTMTVAQSERFDHVFKERMEKLPFRFCWDILEDLEPISSSVEENNV